MQIQVVISGVTNEGCNNWETWNSAYEDTTNGTFILNQVGTGDLACEYLLEANDAAFAKQLWSDRDCTIPFDTDSGTEYYLLVVRWATAVYITFECGLDMTYGANETFGAVAYDGGLYRPTTNCLGVNGIGNAVKTPPAGLANVGDGTATITEL